MTVYLNCGLNNYLQQRLQWAKANHRGVLLNPDEVKEVWRLAVDKHNEDCLKP